jgi:DNA-binding MarR family transcriptional regulator
LQVHPASVTNAVQRLEQDGFVVRSVNPADGRSVLAEITSSGREVTNEATDRLNDEVFALVPIPGVEQRNVYAVLKEMRRAFGDFT